MTEEPIDLAAKRDAFKVASAEYSNAARILLRSWWDLESATGSLFWSWRSQRIDALLKNEAAIADLTDQAVAWWARTKEYSRRLSSGRKLSSGGPVRLVGADKAMIGGSTEGV